MRLYHSLAITLLLACALQVLAAPLHRRGGGASQVDVPSTPLAQSSTIRCAFTAVISNLTFLYFLEERG